MRSINSPLSGFRKLFKAVQEAIADLYAIGGQSPKLVADFANDYYRVASNDSTFANAITFSRSSLATYVDSNGVIQTAASGVARVGHHVYNGTSWVNEGLLVESEQRVNFVTYSEDFTDASWNSDRAIFNANAIIAPDGTTSATKYIATSDLDTAFCRFDLNSANSGRYTGSCFFKAGEYGFAALRLRTENNTVAYTVVVDLSDGSVTDTFVLGSPNGSYAVKDFSNGWYRISLSADHTVGVNVSLALSMSNSATPNYQFQLPQFSGDGTSGVYIWGAQLEAGSTPSSYIPTSGSTATRAAETLTLPAAQLPYNSTNMSIQMDGRQTGDTYTLSRWYDDANNYIALEANASDFTFEQANGGTVDSVTGGSFTSGINVPYNIASRHGSTFINGATDGVALTEDTTPTALPDLSTTDLELAPTYMGTIRTFRMWDVDLGDEGIEEASS